LPAAIASLAVAESLKLWYHFLDQVFVTDDLLFRWQSKDLTYIS
jgi:hypothetical protein